MAKIKFSIESILGGQSPIVHGNLSGQFLSSIAIDPETSVLNLPNGFIYPIGYSKFSDTVPSGAPIWIITNPINQNVYVYASDGEFFSYNSVLASETSIGTPTSGAGNGGLYYNDYVYLMTPTDVSRYGPLSGSPAMANTFWTSTLSLTALTNTTYPGTRNVNYPNHAGHVHSDGAVYFLDYKSGQGLVHKIKTDSSGNDDGSAYNVLDLPFGVKPFDINSYGTDLVVIGSILGSSTVVRQGQSFLFLWDTIQDSFYAQIPIPSAFVSAIENVNGVLYIWGGSIDFGWQLYRYAGGYSVELLWESHSGSPPFAGAVDSYGNRIAWGTAVTTPVNGACIMTYGYQNTRLGTDAVHNIGVADTSSNTLPVISALKFVQQAQSTKKPIIGWRTDTSATYGLSKIDPSVTKNSWFRSEVFEVDKPFMVTEISIPLTTDVDSTFTIDPILYFDHAGTSKTLQSINNTNYSGKRNIQYKALEIEQATTSGYFAKNNFFLEFNIKGTSASGVALPIDITVETRDQ